MAALIPSRRTLVATTLCHTMATPYLSSYGETHSFARGNTRAGEGCERALSHLVKALAEIDGLFAGLKCSDEADSSKQEVDLAKDHGKDQASSSPNEIKLDVHLLSQADEEMQFSYRGKEYDSAEAHGSTTKEGIGSIHSSMRYNYASISNVKEGECVVMDENSCTRILPPSLLFIDEGYRRPCLELLFSRQGRLKGRLVATDLENQAMTRGSPISRSARDDENGMGTCPLRQYGALSALQGPEVSLYLPSK